MIEKEWKRRFAGQRDQKGENEKVNELTKREKSSYRSSKTILLIFLITFITRLFSSTIKYNNIKTIFLFTY